MDDLDSFAAQLQLGSPQLMLIQRWSCELRIRVGLDSDLLRILSRSDFSI
jgi:hypothetical protein